MQNVCKEMNVGIKGIKNVLIVIVIVINIMMVGKQGILNV